MLYMVVTTWDKGKRDEVVKKEKEFIKGTVRKGVKRLGEWASIEGDKAFTLIEVEDPSQIPKDVSIWKGLVEIKYVPVMESEELMDIFTSK
jgi:hypothetical protein